MEAQAKEKKKSALCIVYSEEFASALTLLKVGCLDGGDTLKRRGGSDVTEGGIGT